MIRMDVTVDTDVLDAIREAAEDAPRRMNKAYKARVKRLRGRILDDLRAWRRKSQKRGRLAEFESDVIPPGVMDTIKNGWDWLAALDSAIAEAGDIHHGKAEGRQEGQGQAVLDDETKLVTSRLGQDRFRVAGTAEFNGYNKDIRADRIRPLIAWVNQCFPGINTRQVVPWAGLRPMMPNMMPRVGRGKLANVFYNTGHGHLGWTLSAVTADMLGGVVQGA
jgi:hypothetical protein